MSTIICLTEVEGAENILKLFLDVYLKRSPKVLDIFSQRTLHTVLMEF